MVSKKTTLIARVILAIAVVLVLIVMTVVPTQRHSKAVKYDLECVTLPKRAPLTECKQ